VVLLRRGGLNDFLVVRHRRAAEDCYGHTNFLKNKQLFLRQIATESQLEVAFLLRCEDNLPHA
jgi:hypothetical protein